jgi:hypothetical protein
MVKKRFENGYWLTGGILGVSFGAVWSLYYIYNLEFLNPDIYPIIYQIFTIIIVMFVSLGAAFGTVIGKITFLLKEIYRKK